MNTEIERATSAEELNAICNHPEVRPSLGGDTSKTIDLAPVIENQNNFAFSQDGVAVIFVQMQFGLYEAHIGALPAARGETALQVSHAALHWIFTKTEAMEVVMRVATGAIGVRAMARNMGAESEFTAERAYQSDGDLGSADFMFLTVQRWLSRAPDLIALGGEVCNQFPALRPSGEIGTNNSVNYFRHLGAFSEMAKAHQYVKAVALFNRWAALAGAHIAAVTVADPFTVDFGAALIRGRDGILEAVPCQ